MSHISYNFLADSLLFHEDSIQSNFSNESEARILQELESYRNHCIENMDELQNEVSKVDSSLKVFSMGQNGSIPMKLLTQTALYLEQFVIDDPIFPFSKETSNPSQDAFAQLLGMKSTGLNKMKLAKTAYYLKAITPMVTGQYVKLFPASYHFERPIEIPLRLPINLDNDVLPEAIMTFFRSNAIVRSLKKDDDGYTVEDGELHPCRGITIDFKNDESKLSTMYWLHESEFTPVEGSANEFIMKMSLPEHPPEKEQFDNWVTQSVNSTAKAYFDQVYKETFIASNLNSTYLCSGSFKASLISNTWDTKETVQSYTATQLFNTELPYLNTIDIDKLMQVRKYEANVFTNYRLALEQEFRELRLITDPVELEKRKENAIHELHEVQFEKIKQTINDIPRKMIVNATIGIGGLAAASATGLSLFATVAAMAKGYSDYQEYKSKALNNPAYLLWKTRK